MEHTPTGCLTVVAGVGVEGHKAINWLFLVLVVHPIATSAELDFRAVRLLRKQDLKSLFLSQFFGFQRNGRIEVVFSKLCSVREPDTFGWWPGIASVADVKDYSHSPSLSPLACKASIAFLMTDGIGSPINPAFSMMLMVSFAM